MLQKDNERLYLYCNQDRQEIIRLNNLYNNIANISPSDQCNINSDIEKTIETIQSQYNNFTESIRTLFTLSITLIGLVTVGIPLITNTYFSGDQMELIRENIDNRLSETIKKVEEKVSYFDAITKEKTKEIDDKLVKLSNEMDIKKEEIDESVSIQTKLALAQAETRSEEKERLYTEVVNKFPDSFQALLARGDYYYSKAKYNEAIKDYENAVLLKNNDVNDEQLYTDLGICHYYLGYYEKSIEYYKMAIDISPNKAYNYYNISLSYEQMGNKYKNEKDYINALEFLNEGIRVDRNYVQAYCSIGDIYKLQGKYNEAINQFDKVIEIFPNNAYPYIHKGNFYYDKNEYYNAIDNYKTAIYKSTYRSSDQNILIFRGLANSYFKLNDLSNAKLNYQKVLDINPDDSVSKARIEQINNRVKEP